MSAPPTVEDIVKDARWLIQALDPTGELVRVVDLDRQGYQSASFLDDRMFQSPQTTHVASWPRIVEAIPEAARRDARWIFHIGHVGSTLLARLLGELTSVLSVREPRILRDVAGIPDEKRALYTEPLKALLSRTFAQSETALVKATSFVSEIAPSLLAAGTRCLFMYASPRAYIQTILAGDNSREELRVLAGQRAARLHGRVPSLARPMESEAHLAAAAWACEMTSLEAAANAAPEAHVSWVDFDHLLADVENQLGQAAQLLGFDADPEELRRIAHGPLMGRYSKALEYAYSPSLREELLAESQRIHGTDIDSAIAMLMRAAENAPLLASALHRAKPEN